MENDPTLLLAPFTHQTIYKKKKDTKFNNRKHNSQPIKKKKQLYQILRNLSNNIKHKIDNKNNESDRD